MIRGTTPTHTFRLPFDTAEVCSVRITYIQRELHGVLRLTKETDVCKITSNTISVTLTQEDTLMFDCRRPVQVQLRVLTTVGQSLACRPITIDVGECLDGEVLA